MEFNKLEVIKYLNKNYTIKEDRIIYKTGQQEWGREIVNTLSTIFGYDKLLCRGILIEWTVNHGLDNEAFKLAWETHKLNLTWNPETAQALELQYGISNAEELLTNMLSDEIAREIDAEILRDLRHELKKTDDVIGVVKCLGYVATPTRNLDSLSPRQTFVSTTYNEMINERNNNTFWQDWVRAREQDKET